MSPKATISVSHIAWPPDCEEDLLDELRILGVTTVELAPQRVFGNPLLAKESNVRAKANWYADRGFRIGSFQALLYGTDGMFLFVNQECRQRMKEWLLAVARVAEWCGAGPMVFGAPKSRVKGDLSIDEAMQIAVPFFREVGHECERAGTCLVIEANPEAYGGDFCTRLAHAADLVSAVNSAGFGLHVDSGGLALSGEDFEPVLRQANDMIRHVHASQPHLEGFSELNEVHAKLAKVLHEIDYARTIAIEMRSQTNIKASVRQAVRATQEVYLLKNE